MKPLTQFDAQYVEVLTSVLSNGRNLQRNERTDSWVKEIANVTFIQRGVPLLTLRDIKPKWACVEAVWFLSGSREVSWLNEFGFKAWDKFADPGGRVESATGWQWRHAFGVDQLAFILKELEHDPTTRRAILTSWNPYQTVRGGARLNAPCLPTWHFCMVNQKLNLSIFQRSCDLWFGLPADIAGAGLILELVAQHLEMVAGHVAIHIANAHLYDDAFDCAKKILARANARRGGTVPNPRVRQNPLLDSAMAGEKWVVHELFLNIEEWYTKWAEGIIRGPKLKVGRAQ